MRDRIGDDPPEGYVDDELGLILNPQGRDGRMLGPARAGRAENEGTALAGPSPELWGARRRRVPVG